MSDKISISFKNSASFESSTAESITLFSHHDGLDLLKIVQNYLEDLARNYHNYYTPLGRSRPDTVIIDFIRYLTKNETYHTDSNYYLGKDKNDGDNSNNGHYIFDLAKFNSENDFNIVVIKEKS